MDAIDQEALQRAEQYLASHKIDELMRDLVAALSFYKPEDARQFLIQELQRRERQGPAAGLFSEKEIESVFELADMDMDGFLSKEDCRAENTVKKPNKLFFPKKLTVKLTSPSRKHHPGISAQPP